MNRLFLMTCAAALSLSASAVMAQTQATDEINSYLVPVTILDHPQCNGTGQSAFSLQMQAEDLRIRLSADTWTSSIDMGGGLWGESDSVHSCFIFQERGEGRRQIEVPCDAQLAALPRMCTIEEMRGTDRVQVQMPCPATAEEVPEDDTPEAQILRLDLSLQVTMCQSLLQLDIIDGQWAADLTAGETVTRHQGVLSMLPRSGRSVSRNEQDATISFTMGNGRRHLQGGVQPSYFRILLTKIPVNLPEVGALPARLETNVIVFPTLDGSPICRTGDCNLAYTWNIFRE